MCVCVSERERRTICTTRALSNDFASAYVCTCVSVRKREKSHICTTRVLPNCPASVGVGMYVCGWVYVCVCERDCQGEFVCQSMSAPHRRVCVCVFVCVLQCVCVCVRKLMHIATQPHTHIIATQPHTHIIATQAHTHMLAPQAHTHMLAPQPHTHMHTRVHHQHCRVCERKPARTHACVVDVER